MSTPVTAAPASPSASGPVAYRRADYIGASRHLVIFIVDSLVLGCVCFLYFGVLSALIDPASFGPIQIVLFWVFAWWYLAMLKQSRFRTPGYWIAGAKIVTVDGRRPSVLRMTLRLVWTVMWLVGPINFFVDFLWATVDDERQMLRDLFLETRLVRNRAQPTGQGQTRLVYYTALGQLAMFYRQIRASKTSLEIGSCQSAKAISSQPSAGEESSGVSEQ